MAITLKAQVRGGRLVLDTPTHLPEGSEVALVLADEGDPLDGDDGAGLHASLCRAVEPFRAGYGIRVAPGRTVLPWERTTQTVQTGDDSAAELFFSWVIPGRLAGARAPMTEGNLRALSALGISLLVRLTEAQFVTTEQIEAAGLEDVRDPVHDFGVPQIEQMWRIVDRIQKTLSAGRAAVISCLAGCGRTGTMLSCCLVAQGLSAADAFRFMELVGRPHSETDEQREAVRRFAALWAERAGALV